MPQTKRQTARLRIINSCLADRKYWTLKELVQRLSDFDIKVTGRTVKSDIQSMRFCQQLKYHAPIDYCNLKGYFYSEPDYSIDKLPLNNDDIRALELAATTLNQYRYIPFLNEFTSTIDKIIRVVNRVKQKNQESLLEFIQFEKTPIAIGLEYMDTIINAILTKSPLEFTYQKFKSDLPETTIIHPYLIKEYRNRWYVIAYNQQRSGIRTYAFDRIIKLTYSSIIYIPNTFINLKEYLKNCIGVNLMDGRVEKVKLRFTPHEGMYIKTQKLHRSQKVIQDDEVSFIVELDLVINFELIGVILSYGASVKVLEPKRLADKVADIANKIETEYIS